MNEEYKGLIYSNEEIEKVLQQGSSPFMSRSIYDYIMFQFKQLQAYKDKEKNMDDYIKELLEVNKDINNQLQAYKDKEDKLRELAKDFTGSYLYPIQVLEILDGTSQYESKNNKIVEIVNELNKYTMYPQQKLLFQELLQILNEGE